MSKSLPSGFRLNRRTFIHQKSPAPVLKAIEVLSRLPFGDLLTTRDLAAAIGISRGRWVNYTSLPELEAFRRETVYEGQRMLVWGSKRTIQKLTKEQSR